MTQYYLTAKDTKYRLSRVQIENVKNSETKSARICLHKNALL